MKTKSKTIGERIAKARKDAGMTQAAVADRLNITYQAVSLWETDKAVPDMYNLLALAELFEVSVSSLVEDRKDYDFMTDKNLFDWKHMEVFVKHTARAKGYHDTLKALNFAVKAHDGQTRKNSDIPYIYHPLNLACHCFALRVDDDALIAACLLHDVLEDTDCTLNDLPVGEEAKRLVKLMSHEKNEEHRDEIMKAYFKGLSGDPKAALIKCVDRCNNLTTMSWGLSRDRIYRTINETERYVLPLLKVLKQTPEYNNASWLLQYQIRSMLDIYKRLM